MKKFLLSFILISQFVYSQNYPTFGPEIKVTVNGLSFDVMEPFISIDGNTLFFNSINSADTTNLYYASKINDSTFNYMGVVNGTLDQSPDHLDAVPSMDSLSNFFWTSLRDFPSQTETIHRGVYSAGNVTDISKVYGSFNIYQPGWLVFDAAVNFNGEKLYYSNAFFNTNDCGPVPCIAKLGVAEKVNDTTFDKHTGSELIFSNINDTNYIVYAPQVSKDELEMYFTRLLKGSNNTEICVAVRNAVGDVFSVPSVIYSNQGFTPEAATPTSDQQKIYYHQRNINGVYEIYLRYRTGTSSIGEDMLNNSLSVFPNPTCSMIEVSLPLANKKFIIKVISMEGKEILQTSQKTIIDISNLPDGTYFLKLEQEGNHWTRQIVKE